MDEIQRVIELVNGALVVHMRENNTLETKDGMPPASIEVTVSGGDSNEIAHALYSVTPPGVLTVGNVTVMVDGFAGVSFNRPHQGTHPMTTVKLTGAPSTGTRRLGSFSQGTWCSWHDCVLFVVNPMNRLSHSLCIVYHPTQGIRIEDHAHGTQVIPIDPPSSIELSWGVEG